MLERSRARRQALHILYQREVTGQPVSGILAEKNYIVDEDGEPGEFCALLALGSEEHVDQIDRLIADVSENWAVSRMPLVDRNILRMAVFELVYLDDVPASVTINEAVELAKTFGGEDSSKFVNGVLGRIADQQIHPDASTETHDG
jgi:N utilization substance protein B